MNDLGVFMSACSPIFFDFAGVNGCIEKLDLVPRAVVVGPEAETYKMALAVTENNTWECCGVVVPVIRDTWDADVLALSVPMLLQKNCDGHDMGLILFEPEHDVVLLLWTKQFGAVHSFV